MEHKIDKSIRVIGYVAATLILTTLSFVLYLGVIEGKFNYL